MAVPTGVTVKAVLAAYRRAHRMAQAHDPRGRPACSRCGSKRARRLVYGFVDVGLFLELNGKEPDFELGGLGKRAADRHCQRCQHERQGHPAAPSGSGQRGAEECGTGTPIRAVEIGQAVPEVVKLFFNTLHHVSYFVCILKSPFSTLSPRP
jgi:hypothetical protein